MSHTSWSGPTASAASSSPTATRTTSAPSRSSCPQIPTPVFAPRLAHGLISAKLKERRATREFTSTPIDPGIPYQFGQHFAARWFRVCHSIPDAMGIAVSTPLGTVIHTGDFKIDHTPVDGRTIDLTALASYGEEGVLLLLSDSTYAEVPGYTPSERVVGEALDRAIKDAPGRVLVATFASLVSRVQQVVDAAARYGRKVSIVGRSMVSTVKVASELGYLRLPPGILLPLNATRNLPPEQVVLMTTGSQGRTHVRPGSHRQRGTPRRQHYGGRHRGHQRHADTGQRAARQPHH